MMTLPNSSIFLAKRSLFFRVCAIIFALLFSQLFDVFSLSKVHADDPSDLYISLFESVVGFTPAYTPLSGTTVTIRANISNGGPSEATNVVANVRQTGSFTSHYVVNSYTSYLNSNSGTPQGTYDSSTGTWTIGSIPSGQHISLSISVTVTTTNANDVSFPMRAEIMSGDQDDGSCVPPTLDLTPESPPINCFGNGSNEASDLLTFTITPYIRSDLYISLFESAVGFTPAYTPLSGTTVTIRANISNGGPSEATNVVANVRQTGSFTSHYVVNSYTSYLNSNSGTPQGTYDSSTGTWTIGSIPSGQHISLSISVTVTTTNANDVSFPMRAEIMSGDQNDGSCDPPTLDLTPESPPINCFGNGSNEASDLLTFTITPYIRSDLYLGIGLSSTSPIAGGSLTHIVTLNNLGPSTATNVGVSYPLPSNVVFLSSNQPGYNSSTGLWTISSLASGTSIVLQVQTIPLGTSLTTMQAEIVSGDQDDGSCDPPSLDPTPELPPINCFGNGTNEATDIVTASFTATLDPASADLSVNITPSTATPSFGENIVYTINVTNDGGGAASGVEVTYLLPAGLVYVSDDSGGTYDPFTGIWMVGSIGVSAMESLEITVTVNSTSTIISNVEVTASDQTDPDSIEGDSSTTQDDDASTSVLALQADLSISKTVNNASPGLGQNVIYTITVTNDGPGNATGVSVRDTLPSGVSFVSSNAGLSFDSSSGIWTVGSILNGSSASITITATVNSTSEQINYAEISASGALDPDSVPNDSDSGDDDYDSVSVQASGADLSLAVAADNSTPVEGDLVTYTFTLHNSGPNTATNIEVAVQIPVSLTLQIYGGGELDTRNNFWHIPSLASDADAEVEMQFRVNQVASGVLYAEIDAVDQADTDSTPANLSTTEDDDVTVNIAGGASADLTLSKTVDDSTPTLGDTITYTIEVTNDGPSTATGVVVTDLLPSGVTYMSDSANMGTYDDGTGIWTIGTLASGSGASLDIDVTTAALGTIVNTAEITAGSTDDPNSTFGDTIDQGDYKSVSITVSSGTAQTGTITGHVFTDQDADGVQDSSEVDGYTASTITVSITDGSITYRPTIDSSTGNYSRTVPVGTYTVRITGHNILVRGSTHPATVVVTANSTVSAGSHGVYDTSNVPSNSSGGGGGGSGSSSTPSRYSGSSSSSSGPTSYSGTSSSSSTSASNLNSSNTTIDTVTEETSVQLPVESSTATIPADASVVPWTCVHVGGASPLAFKDVASNNPRRADIDLLSSSVFVDTPSVRLLQGFNGSFGGGRTLSRFEMTKLILSANCINATQSTVANTVFTDVPQDDSEVSKVIGMAYALGIVSGVGDKFYPQNPVSYGELVKILINTGMKQQFIAPQQYINDVGVQGISEESFRFFAEQALAMQLLQLDKNNIFPQNAPVARDAMVGMLAKYIRILNSES